MSSLAATTKYLSDITFRSSFALLIILLGFITLLSGCKGEEEPTPNPGSKNPEITSFTPTSGLAGTTEVVITGKNFSASIADNAVKIGTVVATVKAATSTSITITVPTGAVTAKISVTVNGKTATSTNDFVVIGSPTITNFTPTSGVAGTTEVVITGQNFSATIADNVVKIGNVVATVKAATTTSLTITVPSGAVTGKISITINGMTASTTNDFVVVSGPSDFFTLTVDASYETSQSDNWILASSTSGDWIEVQPYESDETIILNGVVPDLNSFTLHFLTVSQQPGYTLFSMKSIANVPVNETWLLTTPTSTTDDEKLLTLNVNNVNVLSNGGGFNETLSVGCSEGRGSTTSSNYVGNNLSMEMTVLKSPTDILVTLYQSGSPKYVSYKNVTLPKTITLDAATEGVAADRNFTMQLPTNNFYYVAIDAFEQNQKYGYSMSKFSSSTGGASVNLGYKQGYQKYRTAISYRDGKKSVDLNKTGSAVEESHAFPSYDFTFTKSTLNDIEAVSTLPFDVVSLDFQHNQTGQVLLWNVLQPASGTSNAINFKAKSFPQEILDKYPSLPSFDQVQYGIVYGYQYMGSKTYPNMIDQASKNGSILVDMWSDNFFRFAKQR